MAAVTRSLKSRLRRGTATAATVVAPIDPAAVPDAAPVDIAPNDPLMALLEGSTGAVDLDTLNSSLRRSPTSARPA